METGMPGVAARRVDDEVGRVAQALDALAALAPIGQALLHRLGLLGGEVLRTTGPSCAASSALIQGRKSSPRKFGKVSSRLARSPLGSISDGGDAVDGRFFEQGDAQAGLAAAGHADAHGVRDQVLRIVQEQIRRAFAGWSDRIPCRDKTRRVFRSLAWQVSSGVMTHAHQAYCTAKRARLKRQQERFTARLSVPVVDAGLLLKDIVEQVADALLAGGGIVGLDFDGWGD